jgi:multiple sugar transport system substrate-binding protein
MMKKSSIPGITWAHSRGITPLLACAQRYNELHPDIEIIWSKRTLQEFADAPVELLAKKYDLLIIDHPWIGTAAATRCLLPLNEYLPEDFLRDLQDNSAGDSYKSYEYSGNQWALPVDAAAPAASYRADLFVKHNRRVPDHWEDLIKLAKENKVLIPAAEVDLVLHFFMFCIAVGEYPFRTDTEIISLAKGSEALQGMYQLWSLCDKEIFDLNPIAVAEKMTLSDRYWYCPFAFCYSNYSRDGYAEKRLTYTDLIHYKQSGRLVSTLGGTGLAISAFSENKEACLRFATWVMSADIQTTFYAEHSGQPGYRMAWTSNKLNGYMNNYFANTLPAIDRAYVRPRYHGFLYFQDNAGRIIKDYLINNRDEGRIIKKLNTLYSESLSIRDNI